MEKEIFHRCRAAGREFTSEQWHEYLDEQDPIEVRYGEFVYNVNDICLNPERERICVKDGAYGYNVEIKTAAANGLWAYGLSYSCGTGGGGCGVTFPDHEDGDDYGRGYRSKKYCLVAACHEAIKIIKSMGDGKALAKQLIDKIECYRREISRPKVVQLELF